MNQFRTSIGIATLCLIGVAAPVSLADLVEAPAIDMSMSGGEGTGWWGHEFSTAEYGSTSGSGSIFNYAGSTSWDECDVSWWHELEVDPGLGFGFSVTNNLSFTETFTLTADVRVPGWSNGTMMGASISGSLTDTNFNGTALLLGAPDGLLTTYLDESSQLTVGQNVTAGVDFIAGSAAFGPYTAGLGSSGPSLEGPQVTDGYLSIDISFTLSPGDTATFTGAFVVTYVPAPGGLLLTGLLAFGRRRRR